MAHKYEALTEYLKNAGTEQVPLGFAQVEEIIGKALPMSARKHRPWWSNNPDNARITHAWLKAGYKSAQVDMGGETLVFVKDEESGAMQREASKSLLGCLKDEITIAQGVDLTAPVLPEWAQQFDKKWAAFDQSGEAK